MNYKAENVWAAAVAAQRVNKGYVKVYDVENKIVPNRQVMLEFLEKPETLIESDFEQGKKIKTYYQAFTFKIIRGQRLNEFESNAMKFANLETITNSYQLGTICSLPSCYERAVKRDVVNKRIEFAKGGFIGSTGLKVELDNIEVVRCSFSQTYLTHFVTGITAKDEVLFFAFRKELNVGDIIKIKGTVKAHLSNSNSTQLNRVKVIS